MLSIEENDRITKTGPGTPMGNLFRRFWVPALLASGLPERDGPPVRFELLSERLIAFRDSEGKVGVLEERCPHRHASLYWARNEDCGLRCVYHGWKFTTDGTCVDQPAEPESSHFKEHVKAVAYETHEAGGLIFCYMGPKDKTPPFPEHEWTFLSEDHYFVHKRVQQCNYLQNLEGELDTAHLNFLHRQWGDGEIMAPADLRRKRFFLAETDFGLLLMARSDSGPDNYYWRMTPFHLPSYTLIPDQPQNSFTAAIPRDDTSMWGFSVHWDAEKPLGDRSRMYMDVDEKSWIPTRNMQNDYLRDLDKQKNTNWTGIDGIRTQDMAVQEDQDGPVCRRWEEHLGTTDRGIVGSRRLLLLLAEKLEQGVEPTQPWHPQAYRIHSVGVTAPRDADPVQLFLEHQPVPGAVGIGALE
jgi:phthalate 4,5-dioxygenase